MMGKKAIFFLFICIALTFNACTRRSTKNFVPAGESYLSFAYNGAWCWFSDPRAIYFKGQHRRTYAGWVDSFGNITVGFYDYDLKRIETNVLHKNLERDDHSNPSLFIDRTGKLKVFYSKHASSEPIYLLKAKNAEDISDWEIPDTLHLNDTSAYPGFSNTYTYTNICQLADEKDKLYLFWRGIDFKPNFSVSPDSGKSWSPGKILILPDRIYKNRRPYLKVASNNKDVIHFAFTDGHPNVEQTNSIYYAKYRKAALYKASGAKITDWSALPIQPKFADIVYDATKSKEKAWIWDIAENKDGDPVIVYCRFPNDSTHIYYYSVWDNDQWNNYKLINSGSWFPQTPKGETEREPNYSGGIVLDHEDPSIVYLSRLKNKRFEIEKWSTPNNGRDWVIEEVTRNSEYNNVRPFVIRNYSRKDSPRVLWMNVKKYIHYTDYQSSIKMNIK
jgi:hypothetical protein